MTTLLLDMDGVIADFDALGYKACATLGIPVDCEPHEQTNRYFTDHLLTAADRKKIHKQIDSRGWFANLPPVPGAIEGTRALIAAGVDVWICTKPKESNPGCRDEKGRWLAQHLPELERKLIITPNKGMVRGDILLDDAPKFEWYVAAEWTPVIFTRPFNGPLSAWGALPHWSWGEPIEDLLCNTPGKWTVS